MISVYKYISLLDRFKQFKCMKSSEFHRKIKKNGWIHIRTEGSHYIYEKNGVSCAVPFHGSKEMGKGIVNAIIKEMGLK